MRGEWRDFLALGAAQNTRKGAAVRIDTSDIDAFHHELINKHNKDRATRYSRPAVGHKRGVGEGPLGIRSRSRTPLTPRFSGGILSTHNASTCRHPGAGLLGF